MLHSLLCSWTAFAILAMPAAAQADEPTTLSGMLELPDGTPAAGATLTIKGWGANSQRTQAFGAPKNWKDPDPVTADEHGAFTFSFLAPRAYQFVLDADLGEYPTEGWRWSSLEPGGTKDLGTVSFREPCFVVGHIEGRDGEILVDGWRVMGRSLVRDGRERSASTLHAVPDKASGEFRIGPFPPGSVEFYTRSTIKARTGKLKVQAKPGEPVSVVLKYEGPDMRKRVVFSTYASPYYGFDLKGQSYGIREAENSNLVLLDPDGVVLQHAKHVQGTSQDWEFTDVGPGEHVVELRDPRFLSKRFDAVVASQSYRLNLVGSASLQLTVLDQEGSPLEAYGLWVGYEGVNFSPNEYRVRSDGTRAPVDGLVTGVVPGNILVELHGPGGTKLRHAVGEVAAGETREVSLRFGASVPLLGQVRDAAGKPAAGITVEYTRGAYAGLANGGSASIGSSEGVIRIGGIEGSLQTDEQGAFRIENLDAGPWTLRALGSPLAWATVTTKNVAESAPVQLVLPVMGELRGVLLFQPGFDPTKLIVRAAPADLPQAERVLLNGYRPDPTTVKADGSFHVVGLPFGQVQVTVHSQRDSGNGYSSTQQIYVSRIEFELGTPPVELDLEEILPASIHVTVLVSGKAIEGVGVSSSFGGSMAGFRPGAKRRIPNGQRQALDAAGSFTLEEISLNRPTRVFLYGPEDTWLFGLPEVFTPTRRELIECPIELEMVERELLLLNAAGEPLPRTKFGWASYGFSLPGCKARTDQDGKATLRLPGGSYGLFRRSLESKGETAFDWAAGDGPLRVVLPELEQD
ncbi:MAG: hypothetical protein ACI8QC_003430 [Planctomycetota bacterium]|jgi:hypothetical protein